MRYGQLKLPTEVTEPGGFFFLVLITSLGWAGCYQAFYPGLLTSDSVDQFHQALAFRFSDWHPPIMAGIWSLTNIVAPGPSGMFIFFISLYWLGFFLVAASLWQIKPPIGYAAILLPFLPFLICLSGTIWKDVLVFVCLITTTGLLFWRQTFGIRGNPIFYCSITILLLVAALARYNAVLSVFPLSVLLFFPKPALRRPVLTFVRNIVLLSLLGVVVIVFAGFFLNRIVLRAERSGVENSLMLFDLVGISREIGQNLVPGTWTDEQAAQIVHVCYEPKAWDNLAWGNCSFVTQRLGTTGIWNAGLERRWVATILDHPIAYLQHRLAYTQSLFTSSHPFVVQPDAVSVDYGFKKNILFRGVAVLVSYMQSNKYTAILFMPGFWLATSFLASIFHGLRFIRNERHYVSMAMALSAFLYSIPLIFVGIAGDFRYVYWAIAACCIAVLFFLVELSSAHKNRSPRESGAVPELGKRRHARPHVRL